ncbi:MAG: hypothetical protein AB4050_08905 [Synechococcus sp.]
MKSWLILVYVLAGGGTIIRLVQSDSSAERLMAIALLLFAADLARMAIVDIDNFNSVRRQLLAKSAIASELSRFRYSLAVTVVLELLGLLVSWRWIGSGISIVMFSQLMFNLSVTVSVQPSTRPSIRPWSIVERLDVLLADAIALILAVVWSITDRPLGIAIALLAMVVMYLAIKYIPLGKTIESLKGGERNRNL